MRSVFITLNLLLCRLRFVFIMGIGLLSSLLSFSQTNFLNGGVDITIYPNTNVYVGGNVTNETLGKIHNKGSIYLTGDWANNEPSGGIDPLTGKVILDGGSQFIKGSQTTTFNNLDCQGTGTKTLNINTVVAGNTGVLSLNSNPLDLNSKTLIVRNPAVGAITRSSGYIISETDPTAGYGKITWNLANTVGNYIFPFGTSSGTYIPFLYDVSSAGMELNGIGNISVATYPTDVTSSPNNRPLPTGATDLNDVNGMESAATCADRFWNIDAVNYSTNPTANITFTYRDQEWDGSGGSTNNIIEDSLHAWMWNGTQWQNPTLGTVNSAANTVRVTGVNTSAPWTLNAHEAVPIECGNLAVPNAFSPNNDGHSDVFTLQKWAFCSSKFSFIIFDRWGEKVFETEDASKGWDGTYKGKQMNTAVFVYIINATLTNGEKVTKKGNISLIR